MNAVFYITYYFGQDVLRKGFYIDRFNAPWDEMEERLVQYADHLEPLYGQIDWSSGPSGGGLKNFGCNCFMEKGKHEQLMRAFRRAFCNSDPHCVLGPVCELPAHKLGVPEIFDITYQMFEHQQAQQQGERLNEHIATVQINEQLSSPHKKM